MNTVKILIIGNDKISLQIIKGRLLEFDTNWLITTKTCSNAGVELNSTTYNLVLLDCNETNSIVFEKIQLIKNSKSNWNTPVLVCLQDENVQHIKEVLEAGVLDFVLKPFKNIELFARVRTGLSLSSTINKLDRQARIINEGENKISEVLSGLLPPEIIEELSTYGESKPKKYREASSNLSTSALSVKVWN